MAVNHDTIESLKMELDRLRLIAEQAKMDRDLFWPPKDEIDRRIFEIRSGKTYAYVRECYEQYIAEGGLAEPPDKES